jgi:Protein of unknown function (DUF2996)
MPEDTSPQPSTQEPEAQAEQPKVTETEPANAGEDAPSKAPKAAKAPKASTAGSEDVPKAKAPKKEAVEDKPFSDFISQDYLPALEKAFTSKNVPDLKLSFADKQVSGQWMNGERQFTVYFPQENINAQRAFSCTIGKTAASTIEPFLGDERKITLDLLVFGVIQRVNAQKWFGNN